jgi:hypothetical protein
MSKDVKPSLVAHLPLCIFFGNMSIVISLPLKNWVILFYYWVMRFLFCFWDRFSLFLRLVSNSWPQGTLPPQPPGHQADPYYLSPSPSPSPFAFRYFSNKPRLHPHCLGPWSSYLHFLLARMMTCVPPNPAFYWLWDGVLLTFLLRLASSCNPPKLCLLSSSDYGHELMYLTSIFFSFFFFSVLRFEFKALHFLGRCSTMSHNPQSLLLRLFRR